MKDFSGVFTALVTPFKDALIDTTSLRKLVRYQLDAGINGLVVNGTTAESPCISQHERKQIFDVVRSEVAGQVPIIFGTGTNSTCDTIEATKLAERWGADAALVVVPYYNKPPQGGLVRHYQAVAAETSLPILLYNVPSRTIAKLELETIVELSRVSNIVGIKEATGDIEFGKKIIKECAGDFLVTSGDDGSYLDLIFAGAKGVISVASHILPRQFVKWTEGARKGDKAVLAEFEKYRPLISYLYVEANPIPIKAALEMLGLIERDEMRLPLVPLEDKFRPKLERLLHDAGLS